VRFGQRENPLPESLIGWRVLKKSAFFFGACGFDQTLCILDPRLLEWMRREPAIEHRGLEFPVIDERLKK
jgi:hypothetical protein